MKSPKFSSKKLLKSPKYPKTEFFKKSGNPVVFLVFIFIIHTAWKVSKYGVISAPYFHVFSPNTGKCGPEITPDLDTFHAVSGVCIRQIMRQISVCLLSGKVCTEHYIRKFKRYYILCKLCHNSYSLDFVMILLFMAEKS